VVASEVIETVGVSVSRAGVGTDVGGDVSATVGLNVSPSVPGLDGPEVDVEDIVGTILFSVNVLGANESLEIGEEGAAELSVGISVGGGDRISVVAFMVKF
jgi:hypothetical protein